MYSSDDSFTKDSEFSELIFAFVAPVGVDLSIPEAALKERLEYYEYQIESISVTRDVFGALESVNTDRKRCEYTRIKSMMDIGDYVRKKVGKDAVGKGVASQISKRRNDGKYKPRKAYIVRSLKHPDEVKILRGIYSRGFYLIGVQSSDETRYDRLIKQKKIKKENAKELIRRDESDTVEYGQQVNKTFHLADFFVGWHNDDSRMNRSLWRFIDIVFGHPNKTPTFGEYAMYLAFSASLRSADLSRQVGAVLARKGEILSPGANDCPKFGGGLYWPEYDAASKTFLDQQNGRDYMRHKDSNRAAQRKIIDEIITEFKKKQYITETEEKNLKLVLDNSSIRDLTEFGRVVHAEMEALLACARKGISTKEATVYCTTFPCHNCAKHIIAAGITRVIYVEPYLKSKALELHDDAIEFTFPEQEHCANAPKVKFQPFFGIGPRRFFDLFSMDIGIGRKVERKNKDTGESVIPSDTGVAPRIKMSSRSYLELERDASDQFSQIEFKLKSIK